ncbi:MAG: AAA family ATPase [Candidatus Acidiferrales bacterium]
MNRALFAAFGLHENPFSVNPDPRHLFLTTQTQKAFGDMVAGIQSRQGLIVLTGDVGTGKTSLLNYLVAGLERGGTPKALIVNSHLEVSELFELMLADFDVPRAGQGQSAFARLNAWLLELHRTGRTAVLMIDEAQGLPSHALEEIRLLLNLETPNGKLLQIILSGQPELEHKLRRAELRQIQQRVGIRCKTAPLTREETRDCIQQRLRVAGAADGSLFSAEATEAAFFYSRGIPRVINLLCEHALLNALARGTRQVPASMIEDASRELQFDMDRPVASVRAAQAGVPRPNLVSMQPVASKPGMAFAAAAGSSGKARDGAKNIKSLELVASESAARNRVDKATAQSFGRGYVASVTETTEPQTSVGSPAQHGTTNVQGGSPANMGFADVGQIIAELGRTAAVGAPVRINEARVRKSPSARAIAKHEMAEVRAKGSQATAAVRVKVEASISALGTKWKAKAAPRILASLSWLRSCEQSLSRNFATSLSRVYTRVSSASPGVARVTSSLIFWLRKPLPIGPVPSGNTKIRTKSVEDGRISVLNNTLREKAEPILRWLQAPVRSPQRH